MLNNTNNSMMPVRIVCRIKNCFIKNDYPFLPVLNNFSKKPVPWSLVFSIMDLIFLYNTGMMLVIYIFRQ